MMVSFYMKTNGFNKLFHVVSICYFTEFGDLNERSPARAKPGLISTEIGTVERNGFEADVGCSCLE
jgi:hypothetical protein